MRSCRRTALAAVVMSLLGTSVAHAATPFYVPPSPLPPGQPGDVIRSQEISARLLGVSVRDRVRAWRIMYRSTNAQGQPIAVTGALLVPRGAGAGSPLVSSPHGSVGIGDQCAPSRDVGGFGLQTTQALGMLQRGWAVALPDGPGLGTPGPAVYVYGRAQGPTTLDILRAARRFAPAGLAPTGPNGVIAYSEGAAPAVWSAQLQPTYAPDVPLRGVAAGGIPADLFAVLDQLDGSLFAGFLIQAAIGLEAAYPELDIDQYTNGAGRRLIRQALTACSDRLLALGAFRRLDEFVTVNPIRFPAWSSRIEENRAGTIKPPMPVYLYNGRRDEILPFPQARQLYDDWCALGAQVRFRSYPGDHFSTLAQGQDAAQQWLGARLRGAPDAGTCAGA